MKSLKEYSLNISEKDYHAYPAWSHSMVARYAREGFTSIATIHEPIKETDSMKFGSLFDVLLTRPEDFDSEYAVTDTLPPPAEQNVLNTLYTLYPEYKKFDTIPDENIQYAISVCNYQPRWKYQSQYEHIAEYHGYYENLASGKTFVSSADYTDAIEMKQAFEDNEYVSMIFGHTQDASKIEYLYQMKFVANMLVGKKKLRVKIMPDLLVVNHEDKTVQPVDLKTSSASAISFKDNFLKFRYDIEASMYSDVLRVIMDEAGYVDYTILPYLFADISRSDKLPLVFSYPQYDETQLNGLSFKDYNYKGWRNLLDEIVEYENTNAVVPAGFSIDGPNDLLILLNS